jgi:hypothetical protein
VNAQERAELAEGARLCANSVSPQSFHHVMTPMGENDETFSTDKVFSLLANDPVH